MAARKYIEFVACTLSYFESFLSSNSNISAHVSSTPNRLSESTTVAEVGLRL